jgi:hypothetical protein
VPGGLHQFVGGVVDLVALVLVLLDVALVLPPGDGARGDLLLLGRQLGLSLGQLAVAVDDLVDQLRPFRGQLLPLRLVVPLQPLVLGRLPVVVGFARRARRDLLLGLLELLLALLERDPGVERPLGPLLGVVALGPLVIATAVVADVLPLAVLGAVVGSGRP